MSPDELPVKRHRGTLVDARLHLLDRQLLGRSICIRARHRRQQDRCD